MTNLIGSTAGQSGQAQQASAATAIKAKQDAARSATTKTVAAPAAVATISDSARLLAAATDTTPALEGAVTPVTGGGKGSATAKAASAMLAATAVVKTAVAQTSANAYAAKVRAVLALNPSATVSSVMAKLGIPQAEQQQVSSALGSDALAKQPTTSSFETA